MRQRDDDLSECRSMLRLILCIGYDYIVEPHFSGHLNNLDTP